MDQKDNQKLGSVILQLPAARRPAASRFVRPLPVMRSNFLPGRLSRQPKNPAPGMAQALLPQLSAGFAYRGRLPKPANDCVDPSSVFASKFLLPPRRVGGVAAALWSCRRFLKNLIFFWR